MIADAKTQDTMTVVVADRTVLAEDVVGLVLRRTDGGALPAWDAGSHIDLVFETPELGLVTRQYSLCGDLADDMHWRIAVLGERGGRGGSRHLVEHAVPGTALRARGPRNHFGLVAAPSYVFLAGGIGITPLLPMVDITARAGVSWQLHYAGRRRSRMAFLSDLQDAHPGRVTVVTEDEDGLPDFKDILSSATPGAAVYTCGPAPMLDAVVKACADVDLPAPHLERFRPVPTPLDPVADQPVEVEFRRLGITRTVAADESILDVAEELGSEVFGSCREGICGTCETRVIDGRPDHRDSVLGDDRRTDHMVICVSWSRTPRLVLDA